MKYYWLKFAELISRVFPRRMSYGIARRIADLYLVFDKPGLSRIFCNIHPHMAAYVMAVEGPEFAGLDGGGGFFLSGLSPGT